MGIDEFKNPPIAEALILLGSRPRGRILVFEGASDETLWKQHVELGKFDAKPIVANGRDNVIECISKVYPKHPNRILGIVDRDYNEAQRLNDECFLGIISSTLNDIELDILSLDRFMDCLGPSLSHEKLKRIKVSVQDLEVFASKAAAAVGTLRKLNKCRDLNLDFKCYELKSRDLSPDLMPSDNWFSIEKVVEKYLKDKTNVHKLTDKKEALELCKVIYDEAVDKIILCRGHDVSSVLAILHNHFRKTGRSTRNTEDINDLILGHISTDEFANLNIYQDLIGWLKSTLLAQ
jgi:hypothetical protein